MGKKNLLYKLLRKLLQAIEPLMSDKLFIKLKFRLVMGYKLNLKNPQTFSEKLQWLKLYDRNPDYTIMVDKVKAKEYVASILGREYIIPTLGVWDNPDQIDFEALPDRFVLKCNHNSGLGMYICKDKSKMDIEEVKAELRKGLKQNYYKYNKEWPYKNVPRKILAETFINPSSKTNDLADYKFFCFDGEPKFCQVISGRETGMQVDFFDKEWNHQPFHEPYDTPFANPMPQRPEHLDLMWNVARKLAEGKAFVRIDFYDVNGKVYFGEITFFPTSGLGGFEPKEWDIKLGNWIKLSNKR